MARIAPTAERFTLANGLEVVVIPDHRAPVVTHMIWYRVGAADDPHGKSGIAHFLEHLMFKGTKNHPAGEFSGKVSEFGGSENAFTTDDATAYHQTVPKEQLATVMALEADRMTNLVLTDEVVLPERDVILEERRMRIDNDPGAQLSEAIDSAQFQNHHYGIPTIGWAHEIADLTKDDAIAFYDRYYGPNNAILVVSGDVTTADVRRLAEETYGKVTKQAETSKRSRPAEPDQRAPRAVSLADARVSEPSWQQSYLVPSYNSKKPGEAEALEVLADILGGGPTSRLHRDVVVEKAIATSAGAWYSGSGLDYGRFVVAAAPRGDTTLDALGDEIEKVIADIRDNGVSDEEVARSKRRTRAAAIYSQDSQGMLARIVGTALTSGGTLEDTQNWPARIDRVTADDVRAAARAYLDKRRSVTGSLLTAPAPAAGRS